LDAVGLARSMGWGRLILRIDLFLRDTNNQRLVQLVPTKGTDGVHTLACLDTQAGPTDDWSMRSLGLDDGESVSRFSHVPDKSRGLEWSTGTVVGLAGMLIGAMGLGMMIASRFKR
jgi:hypothetical protein